jgi:hypothetical protein
MNEAVKVDRKNVRLHLASTQVLLDVFMIPD